MLRVVHNIIIQGYLKNADRVHAFFFGSLINSLRVKNRIENYNVKNVILFSYKQENSFLKYTQTNSTTKSKTCITP